MSGGGVGERRVVVRMTVEYEVDVPADWDPWMIEFHRNDGSWCATNAIDELDALFGDDAPGCMCNAAQFEYVREAVPADEWSAIVGQLDPDDPTA